jgi:predicted phosphodiesterase
VPSKLKPILIVPDTHRPYHDERAWQLMLKVGKDLKPHYLVHLGDLADFYSVSSHSKNPSRVKDLDTELQDVNKALDELDALGAKDKRFVAGNHEDRLTRYLQDKAPELFKTITIPGLLHLKSRGWDYTPYKKATTIGKVDFTHDVGSSSGRSAVFNVLDTYQHSAVSAHVHRLQFIVEGNARGEQKLSAMFGWLGDVEAIDYMHEAKAKKNWALGFGVGYVDDTSGVAYLTPVPIVKVKSSYTAVVNGKFYST